MEQKFKRGYRVKILSRGRGNGNISNLWENSNVGCNYFK